MTGLGRDDWFKQFLEMPHGVPSHDTFGSVFAQLNPEQFRKCFVQWIQVVNESMPGQIVPIDGKQLLRSHDKILDKNAIHMVSAWAAENRLVLGQVKVDDKSNEITAIPQLLDLLELAGCIVTIDALGCQKEIAAKIIEKEADYVLALKGNQGNLANDVKGLFDRAQETEFEDCDYHRTEDQGLWGRFMSSVSYSEAGGATSRGRQRTETLNEIASRPKNLSQEGPRVVLSLVDFVVRLEGRAKR